MSFGLMEGEPHVGHPHPAATRWVPALAILALAFAASATSLGNGFAYDDNPIIAENAKVHGSQPPWRFLSQPYWPSDSLRALYRPVTLALFDVQWRVGDGSPRVFHAANVLFYLAACLAVYWLALSILPRGPAWIAAAVFAVHPVHVEAVGNVVGQSELVVGSLLALAVVLYLRARAQGRISASSVTAIAGLYLIAGLAKEHAIILPALLAAAELTVVSDPRSLRARLPQLLPLGLTLIVVAAGLLITRTVVLGTFAGDFPHPALRHLSAAQRMLILFREAPVWLRLLFWPAHLQADYSPLEFYVGTDFGLLDAVGLALLGGALTLAIIVRRQAPVGSFGVFWMAVALLPVSNLLAPTGIIVAERALFLGSIGAVLVVGALAAAAWPAVISGTPLVRGSAQAAVAAILLFGAWRSAQRQPVWKDNATLFAQTVLDAPLSYKAHWSHGGYLFEAGRRDLGEREYQTAIALYPEDPAVLADLADRYRKAGFCEPAVPLYRKALVLDPDQWSYRTTLIICLMKLKDVGAARAEALTGIERGPAAEQFRRIVEYADTVLAREQASKGAVP